MTTNLLVPAGVVVTSASDADPHINPLVWTDQNIPSGTAVTHTVRLAVDPNIHARLTIGAVTLSAHDSDPDPTNNAALATIHLG